MGSSPTQSPQTCSQEPGVEAGQATAGVYCIGPECCPPLLLPSLPYLRALLDICVLVIPHLLPFFSGLSVPFLSDCHNKLPDGSSDLHAAEGQCVCQVPEHTLGHLLITL